MKSNPSDYTVFGATLRNATRDLVTDLNTAEADDLLELINAAQDAEDKIPELESDNAALSSRVDSAMETIESLTEDGRRIALEYSAQYKAKYAMRDLVSFENSAAADKILDESNQEPVLFTETAYEVSITKREPAYPGSKRNITRRYFVIDTSGALEPQGNTSAQRPHLFVGLADAILAAHNAKQKGATVLIRESGATTRAVEIY